MDYNVREQFIYNAGMHQESDPGRSRTLDKSLAGQRPGTDYGTKLGFIDLASTVRPLARVTGPFNDAGQFDNPVFDTRQLIGWKGLVALPETGIVLSDTFADRVGPYLSKAVEDHIALGYPTEGAAIILDYRQGMQGGQNRFDAPNSHRKHFDASPKQMLEGTEIKSNMYTRSTVQQTAFWNGTFVIDPAEHDPMIHQLNEFADYQVEMQISGATRLTSTSQQAIQGDRLHIHNKEIGAESEFRIFGQIEIRPARPGDYNNLENENPHLARAVQAAKLRR